MFLDRKNKTFRIVGVDPGPEKTGWGAINMVYNETGEHYNVFYADGGKIESDVDSCIELVNKADIVGVESVRGYSYDKFRTSYLFETNFVAGIYFGVAKLLDKVVYEAPATVVRKYLFDTCRAPDDLIKERLSDYVKNLPVRSNVHQRDGLAVAVYVAYSFHTGHIAPGRFNGSLQTSRTKKPLKKNVRTKNEM